MERVDNRSFPINSFVSTVAHGRMSLPLAPGRQQAAPIWLLAECSTAASVARWSAAAMPFAAAVARRLRLVGTLSAPEQETMDRVLVGFHFTHQMDKVEPINNRRPEIVLHRLPASRHPPGHPITALLSKPIRRMTRPPFQLV